MMAWLESAGDDVIDSGSLTEHSVVELERDEVPDRKKGLGGVPN